MNNLPGVVSIIDDELITEGKGILYGFQFDCSADGGRFTIYDGLDADSGRLLLNPAGWQYDANTAFFSTGIPFERGLYVVLGATTTRASVIFKPERGYTAPTVESVAQALLALLER